MKNTSDEEQNTLASRASLRAYRAFCFENVAAAMLGLSLLGIMVWITFNL